MPTLIPESFVRFNSDHGLKERYLREDTKGGTSWPIGGIRLTLKEVSAMVSTTTTKAMIIPFKNLLWAYFLKKASWMMGWRK